MDQLIVTLYRLSICPSGYKQLIRTLFEVHIVCVGVKIWSLGYLIGWSEQNSTPPAIQRSDSPVAKRPMQVATAWLEEMQAMATVWPGMFLGSLASKPASLAMLLRRISFGRRQLKKVLEIFVSFPSPSPLLYMTRNNNSMTLSLNMYLWRCEHYCCPNGTSQAIYTS